MRLKSKPVDPTWRHGNEATLGRGAGGSLRLKKTPHTGTVPQRAHFS